MNSPSDALTHFRIHRCVNRKNSGDRAHVSNLGPDLKITIKQCMISGLLVCLIFEDVTHRLFWNVGNWVSYLSTLRKIPEERRSHQNKNKCYCM